MAVIRDNTMAMEGNDHTSYRPTNMPDTSSNQLVPDDSSGVSSGNVFEAYGGIRDPGQTWLWDMNPLQFNSESLL